MFARAVSLTTLQPERVCVIKPSSLGDVVHALPVLAALRDRWPSAHLSWVVNRGLRGLLDGHPHLDEVIPFDRGAVGFHPRGLRAFGRFARELRDRQFDLAIDLQGLLRSGLMTRATHAKVRVGLGDAREGASCFYTHKVPMPTEPTHAVDKLMRVAGALGCGLNVDFVLAIHAADRTWAERTLCALPRPRLVINVGARWLTKRWPAESFARVAERAVRERGATLIAVGAPEDRPLVDVLIQSLADQPILDLVGRTSLPQLAAICEASDCVLSNDTGPLHLAAATGTRVVGVYTCTSPTKTGPYGTNAVSVSSQIWCAASCIKTCNRLECMNELTPDRVWAAVDRQLDRACTRLAS